MPRPSVTLDDNTYALLLLRVGERRAREQRPVSLDETMRDIIKAELEKEKGQ